MAEGRDIGTVVAPDAEVKVFLTADPAERARRRAAELGVDAATVLAEQTIRDERDRTREHSPLAPAEGAVVIDTTGMTFAEVVGRISALVRDATRMRILLLRRLAGMAAFGAGVEPSPHRSTPWQGLNKGSSHMKRRLLRGVGATAWSLGTLGARRGGCVGQADFHADAAEGDAGAARGLAAARVRAGRIAAAAGAALS